MSTSLLMRHSFFVSGEKAGWGVCVGGEMSQRGDKRYLFFGYRLQTEVSYLSMYVSKRQQYILALKLGD